jgi:hypothetical protein
LCPGLNCGNSCTSRPRAAQRGSHLKKFSAYFCQRCITAYCSPSNYPYFILNIRRCQSIWSKRTGIGPQIQRRKLLLPTRGPPTPATDCSHGHWVHWVLPLTSLLSALVVKTPARVARKSISTDPDRDSEDRWVQPPSPPAIASTKLTVIAQCRVLPCLIAIMLVLAHCTGRCQRIRLLRDSSFVMKRYGVVSRTTPDRTGRSICTGPSSIVSPGPHTSKLERDIRPMARSSPSSCWK